MSITAQLICRETRQFIWLGKPVRSVAGSISYFHLGFSEDPRIWEDALLISSICKFLARTHPAILEVLLDPEFNELAESDGPWLWIGNDASEDVTFEEYVSDLNEEVRSFQAESTGNGATQSGQGYLVCLSNGNRIRLGLPYLAGEKIDHFFIESHEKLSSDIPRMQALFKFLAESTGDKMRVMLTDELNAFLSDLQGGDAREIGGRAPGDISFEDYLRDWPGR
jgi:hypothetical protein